MPINKLFEGADRNGELLLRDVACMSVPGATLAGQLERQSGWLTEHWRWLLDTRVLPYLPPIPSALDVGSGPGVVAASLSDRLNVTCLDIDPEATAKCRSRGLRSIRGDAHALPFRDRSFDIVQCSFLLMWLHDPERALGEMLRVSRHAVLLLAEPDHGGRIDHPEPLHPLKDLMVESLRAEGADPHMGRRLRALCSSCGVDAEVGVHPGSWDLERTRREAGENGIGWELRPERARSLSVTHGMLPWPAGRFTPSHPSSTP